MTKKVKGAISLQNGEFLDCDLEIEERPVLSNEEFLAEQTRKLNEMIKELRIPASITFSSDDSVPTGPIVDSTLAEQTRESNG